MFPPRSRRVYNLGLDEFFSWYGQEPRPGFTKATVSARRVALEARGLGAVSINVRITAVRKLAVETADNGLLIPRLGSSTTKRRGGHVPAHVRFSMRYRFLSVLMNSAPPETAIEARVRPSS